MLVALWGIKETDNTFYLKSIRWFSRHSNIAELSSPMTTTKGSSSVPFVTEQETTSKPHKQEWQSQGRKPGCLATCPQNSYALQLCIGVLSQTFWKLEEQHRGIRHQHRLAAACCYRHWSHFLISPATLPLLAVSGSYLSLLSLSFLICKWRCPPVESCWDSKGGPALWLSGLTVHRSDPLWFWKLDHKNVCLQTRKPLYECERTRLRSPSSPEAELGPEVIFQFCVFLACITGCPVWLRIQWAEEWEAGHLEGCQDSAQKQNFREIVASETQTETWATEMVERVRWESSRARSALEQWSSQGRNWQRPILTNSEEGPVRESSCVYKSGLDLKDFQSDLKNSSFGQPSSDSSIDKPAVPLSSQHHSFYY
jgi:hypothetical protein